MKKLLFLIITLLFASGISFAQNQISRKPNQGTGETKPNPKPGGNKPTPGGRKPKPAQKPKATHGYIKEHEWIDLGLPSGLKWATCNVGALYSNGYGDYFAWGETTTKSEYVESNNTTYNRSVSNLQLEKIINTPGNLTLAYDAARANWGGSWRMPTKAEMEELVEKCNWTWTSQGDHDGYLVTGPNDNSIFLPAAGWYYDEKRGYAEDYGAYWCSLCYDEKDCAFHLNFCRDRRYVDWGYRYCGASVRPVSE